MTSKSQKEKVPGIFTFFFRKMGRARSRAGSVQVFMQNWNLFGLRGNLPYCKRFVLAGTQREPSKQSLWEKGRTPSETVGDRRKPSEINKNPEK